LTSKKPVPQYSKLSATAFIGQKTSPKIVIPDAPASGIFCLKPPQKKDEKSTKIMVKKLAYVRNFY
jgi:hypothetical protein